MDINLPTDCGNAPRIGIVSEFAVNWAQGKAAMLRAGLVEGAALSVAGSKDAGASSVEKFLQLPFSPESMELYSVITHGRLASCDGVLRAGDKRLDFSLVFRFASTSKAAKIARLRLYCLESSPQERRAR